MECHLVLVLFFLLCSVQGIEHSEAKTTRELDKFSNSRKILQTNNQAQISISPSLSPVKKHHHHHKHKRIPISPSPSPLQNPNPKSQIRTVPNPNSKHENRSVPLRSPGFIVSPSAKSKSSNEKHAENWRIYASIFGGASLLLLISIIILIFIRGKKVVTVKPWATGLSGQLQKAFVKGLPALKRTEIENACEYFSNIIGSFDKNCIMYKGTLSSGVEIAVVSSLVQKVKGWSKDHESHFRNKITSLSKVNHRNFVNLLGFCEESRPFTRMMVFEYAPNGTLFEHLHNEEMGSLDWSTRLRIAVGIAYCLDHMHQLDPPVLLTNLDSSTVYLTDDLAAKVSDLNLWSKDQNTLDKETIVYKYGLILLEILTGDLQFSALDNPLLREIVVDKRVGDFDEGNLGRLREVVRECCDLEPKKRPGMNEVARRMREITEMPPHGAMPKVSPLWWAELEIMSPVSDE
ncbi:hypothetical protein LUZ60_003862 [Juncus effusus]|nr:hypothetical protein LUZ60_003862 [Juncus effusus]